MGSSEIHARKIQKQMEKQSYELRRDQVFAVKNKVFEVSDDNVRAINREIDNCSDMLLAGIKGIDCVDNLLFEMEEKKEASGIADGYLNAYDSKLGDELGDCNRKIADLESEICRLESEYQQALADEERARREALEKAMRALKVLP